MEREHFMASLAQMSTPIEKVIRQTKAPNEVNSSCVYLVLQRAIYME